MGLIQTVSGTRRQKQSNPSLVNALATRAAGAATSAALYGIRQLEEALGLRFDPAPAYLFYVELSGIIVGLFTECSGLSIEREIEEVPEGGVNDFVHKLPGPTKFPNITLKRGLSVSRSLWDWYSRGMYDFHVDSINFSIIQGAPGHNMLTNIGAGGWQQSGGGFGKVKHWDIEGAYPVKWEASDLSTSSAEVAIETIEIAHHGLSLSYEMGTPLNPLTGALPTP